MRAYTKIESGNTKPRRASVAEYALDGGGPEEGCRLGEASHLGKRAERNALAELIFAGTIDGAVAEKQPQGLLPAAFAGRLFSLGVLS